VRLRNRIAKRKILYEYEDKETGETEKEEKAKRKILSEDKEIGETEKEES
jgi:hypothetical protein